LEEVERKYRFYSERGVPVEKLDAAQLHEAEPNLRPGLAGALLMPADGVCYPPCAARYMLEHVVATGGALRMGDRVIGFSDSGVRLENGEQLNGGAVVLATGALAGRLCPELEVRPRKGHLLITDRYPGFLNHQLIELGYLKSAHSSTTDSVAFNAQPRVTGQVLIGSSRQFGAEEPEVERGILGRMLRRAIEYMPDLADLSAIRTWTGFRAATPDKLPLIGRYKDCERVYLATGHEGLGISTSLATGRMIADEVAGRSSEISREPFAPGRTFAFLA
jgi:glycine/D-amino acid oxidase-like deaminating enzyme